MMNTAQGAQTSENIKIAAGCQPPRNTVFGSLFFKDLNKHFSKVLRGITSRHHDLIPFVCSALLCSSVSAAQCFDGEYQPRQSLITKNRTTCVAEAERFQMCAEKKCFKPESDSEQAYCDAVSFLSEKYQIYEYCNAQFNISEPWNMNSDDVKSIIAE